jgi:hypothetical protein
MDLLDVLNAFPYVYWATPIYWSAFPCIGIPQYVGVHSRVLDKGTGVRKSGGCLTTALAITFEPGNDPAQAFPISLLQVWCKLWASDPKWQAAISEVWDRTRKRLESKHLGRWNGVTGHIGAVIATLLDLGWDPVGPATWKDNRGHLCALDSNSSSLKKDLQSIIGGHTPKLNVCSDIAAYTDIGAYPDNGVCPDIGAYPDISS